MTATGPLLRWGVRHLVPNDYQVLVVGDGGTSRTINDPSHLRDAIIAVFDMAPEDEDLADEPELSTAVDDLVVAFRDGGYEQIATAQERISVRLYGGHYPAETIYWD